MKTDDWVLLAAIAAGAWILTRRPGATIAATPVSTPRTGTVTAGPLTAGSARQTLAEQGRLLMESWRNRPGEPTLEDWYGYS